MFGSLGPPELIIIGLIVVLLFGVGKLSGLGKDLGSSVKEFRKAVRDDDDKPAQQLPTQQYQQPAPPPYQQPTQPQYTPPPAPQQPTQPQGDAKNTNIF
jgi:sec-independent protein translocase protein TatA